MPNKKTIVIRIRKGREMPNKKTTIAILVVSLVILTCLFSLINLTIPYLIYYYATSDGMVFYYLSQAPLTPEFVIKPYLNSNNEPAYISVFVNLPNGTVPLEQKFASSLVIPFAKLNPYMSCWFPYAKEANTSLLVIVTYIDGNKAYTSVEEVDYSPFWIINCVDMQVVAEVNVVGKSLNVNWGLTKQQAEGLFQNQQTSAQAKATNSSYSYKINVIIQNETKSYTISNKKYNFSFVSFSIKDISVPVTFVAMSNNVNRNDKIGLLTNSFSFFGNDVSWDAVANTSNYGGPYIGSSYNATVNWRCSIGFSQPANLDNPIFYIYYNATVAVVHCTVYNENEPIDNVTVFEVTWASPSLGFAFETSNGETIIYTNISGKTYISKAYIGDGSVGFYFEYLNKINEISSQSIIYASPYAYINWTGNVVSYSGKPVHLGPFSKYYPGGGVGYDDRCWSVLFANVIYVIPNSNSPKPKVSITGNISLNPKTNALLGIVATVLASSATPELMQVYTQVVSVILSIASRVELSILPSSLPNLFNSFIDYMTLTVSICPNTTGHVYLSVLKYSAYLPIPVYGFMLNYSSFNFL